MSRAAAAGSSHAGIATIVQAVAAMATGAGAVLAAYHGGHVVAALLAAVLGVATVAVTGKLLLGRLPRADEFVQDGLSVFLIAWAADAATRIWQVPGIWPDLQHLSPLGSAIGVGLYLAAIVWGMERWREYMWPRARLFLLVLPFLLNALLLLASTGLVENLGWRVTLRTDHYPVTRQVIGRTVVLAAFNLAAIVGTGFIVDRRGTWDLRLLGLAVGAAFFAAMTPVIADYGSGAGFLDSVPRLAAIVAVAVAMAGLWGQTFLVTGVLLDALRGRRPSWQLTAPHWRSGATKGAIYGGLFLALVHAGLAFLAIPGMSDFLLAHPVLAGAIAGPVLFPLARTIVESFDGSDPFWRRLRDNAARPWDYARGLVVGVAIGLAFQAFALPSTGAGTRFLYGFLAGAAAYGGVDLVRDLAQRARGLRRHVQVGQLYGLGVLLGGAVGGALAWYFDAAQLASVAQKFTAYGTPHFPAAGRGVESYVIYPLFSKWGAVDLGTVGGGAKLLFSESLSGVINWSLAAPLFSVNLVLLTALIERRTAPIRGLFSVAGVVGLVEQAVRVLRWGLWMAPIIYSFLKMAPDPTWYNQDGAVRTGVATVQSLWLSPEDFRAWSLQGFLGLLAYDWLRVLIWFDHMGLRVATLVNLSFIGGDRLDERAARSLGFSARSRAIPEGIRRFATWAPLLIPFYIPRGAEWDQVWTGAEQVASQGGALLPSVATLMVGYAIAAAASAVIAVVVWLRHVPEPVRKPAAPQVYKVTNGLYTIELDADGRGFSRVLSAVRPGFELDITRRPDDPLSLRGKVVYLRDVDPAGRPASPAWSLGRQPMLAAGPDYAVEQTNSTGVSLRNSQQGIAARLDIEVAAGEPVECWKLVLENREDRARTVELTTYQELGLHAAGAYQRTPAYNAIHVGTWFVRSLGAVLARNRLLKDSRPDPAAERATSEVAFHAVRTGPGIRLVGYEDSRSRFLGEGTLRAPAMLGETAPRDPADEGLLYGFDPAASLRVLVELPPRGSVEVRLADGWADDERVAARRIARHLGIPQPEPAALAATLQLTREVIDPHGRPFAFSADGTELHLTPFTPRPWTHVIANPGGHGCVVDNGGDIFSFSGNAQQNSITPFSMDTVPSQIPGQLIYLVDRDSGELDTPTFIPCRRPDAVHEVVYGRGWAAFRKRRGTLETELTACVLPEAPAELRILRIRNHGETLRRFRVVPYAQIALAELPMDTRWTGIACAPDPEHSTLLYATHGHEFRRGWAFMAMSLPCEAHETVRARFVGGDRRDLANPCFAAFGGPDAGYPDDGYRCAAMAGHVDVPAGGEAVVVVVLGQASTFAEATHVAHTWRHVETALTGLEATKLWWADQLGGMRIETNQPGFDRLVNDWLPYQMLTARLWGRTGPSQRSGAFGFRDQLQDVLPMVFHRPELTRRQIVLNAGQQFVEGDVFKWWHVAWDGRTGRGERTRASDPHLWLPYVVTRYVAATDDIGVLDELAPFLEGVPVPRGREGMLQPVRLSRDSATVYGHCVRAIDHALSRRNGAGLPLMGAGDWNDGINLPGHYGRGISGWVAFFLYDVLVGFAGLAEVRGDSATAGRYRAEALRLRDATETIWRGDRYLRAIADNGAELAFPDCLMSAWPALSGAVGFDRGREAIEAGLARLERPTLIQLLDPAFDEETKPYPGRIADYPPGVRENGGQYSHGASWLVDSLARLAEEAPTAEAAAALRARAFETWVRVSPLDDTTPDRIDRYGLPPHQQPADVYWGPGYEGRGGWSWYTGSAARMVSAGYAILGLRMAGGELVVPDDLFEPRGELQVKRLWWRGRAVEPEGAPQPTTASASISTS